MIKVICCVLGLLLLHQSTDTLMVQWRYQNNDSTYRAYSGYLVEFVSIAEYGNDETYYDGGVVPANYVQLFGDVDYGDLTIIRLQPTCWRVDMISDYNLLKKTWRANPDVDGSCYEYYFPIMNNGTK